MTAPKPLPRCCEMDDAIDRAERCTAGHGGALCDRCFSKVVNAAPSPARDEVREAAEDVVRGDWWGHYCPSCGSTVGHGPECRVGRLAKALSSARAARRGE